MFLSLSTQTSSGTASTNEINTALQELDDLQKELFQTSKSSLPITRKISSFIKKVNKLLSKRNGFACSETIKIHTTRLLNIVSMLDKKKCGSMPERKCIPDSVVNEFSPKLSEAISMIQEIIALDQNENSISDICEEEKICSKPCGPNLCCMENQTCKVDDPCIGDPACTSVPSYQCVPPDDDTVIPLTKITSPAFENNETIPVKYTCDGSNISPPLQIENPPADTKSFALIVDDPDAPGGTFVHWVVFNISPQTTSLAEDFLNTDILRTNVKFGLNDFGEASYGGPCPPSGPAHRYIFTIYALDTTINLEEGITKKQLLDAMEGHILAQAKLTGKYKR